MVYFALLHTRDSSLKVCFAPLHTPYGSIPFIERCDQQKLPYTAIGIVLSRMPVADALFGKAAAAYPIQTFDEGRITEYPITHFGAEEE